VGIGFEISERIRLELALLPLTALKGVEEVLFWGKIEGVARSYYLAVALTFRGKYGFPHKRFFWA
jgi:hypothetical protein